MKGETFFSGAVLKASVSLSAMLISGAAVAQTTTSPTVAPAAAPAARWLVQRVAPSLALWMIQIRLPPPPQPKAAPLAKSSRPWPL